MSVPPVGTPPGSSSDFTTLFNNFINGQGTGAAAPSSTGYSGDDPPVFWGYEDPSPGNGAVLKTLPDGTQVRGRNRSMVQLPYLPQGYLTEEYTGRSRVSGADKQVGLSSALQEFYLWDEEERRKWGQHLADLGLIAPEDVNNFKVLEEAWKESVQDAANMYAGGDGHRVTPWQAARIVAGTREDIERRKKKFADEAPFSGTKTQVSSSVDLTDPTTAKAVINDVLSQMLGRAANPEELSQFTATLNAAERANPTTTTTTGTYDAGSLVSSSSVSTGGIDRGQVIQDQAQNLPDYGAFQAATTYADALFRAIQSPV